ncbi:MAG: LysM peptidoglycan-binding domain-containing protein [Burkholderiales bacterium]|nr:LysM peptidoglycan-binding domain-containing protein [Burkholderiales bacterium]
MKNKLIALYSGTILLMMACSSTNQTMKSSVKKPSNPFDASLMDANNLCNSGKYDLALAQLKKSYAIASNNIKTPSINKQQAMVISAYGDCYSTQAKYDTAIESYEAALQSKYPPTSGYIGITKAYLEQNNYPKAALYISSYPGNENTEEILQLKIKSLTGLLNNDYEISSSNRKLLQDKLSQLKQNLTKLNKNQQVKSVTTQKQNLAITPQTTVTKPVKTNDTIVDTSPTKNTFTTTDKSSGIQNFQDRIKVSNNGRHYIIINRGDTLFNIAKRSKLTEDKLIQLNNLKNNYVPLGIRVYLD